MIPVNVQATVDIVQETADCGLSGWEWGFYGGNRSVSACASFFFVTFCLSKKDPSNQCTAWLLDNALMLLYYYCGELLWDVDW